MILRNILHRNRFNRFFVPNVFNKLLKQINIPTRASWLEIGAGKGYISLMIYEKYHPQSLIITDYDEFQVNEAKKHFTTHLGKIPEIIQFKQSNITHTLFEDKKFDYIICSLVFHHVENSWFQFKKIPIALKEIKRILKSKLFFIIIIYH